ncbi:hypothetical protein COO91_05788 [Nostoc flagelliforme CCNUN1]|uniref:Uncharacterized protein n=1 Tax=Nostoc flagelliforme CCNUN1 TaxID=2038116 RepID=A0A2K8SWP5_9NOSO|nr:hypothetical protein COO91_05788 [Nostoc flagelliforme CCNUN1]
MNNAYPRTTTDLTDKRRSHNQPTGKSSTTQTLESLSFTL